MTKYLLRLAILLFIILEPGICPAQVYDLLSKPYKSHQKSATVREFLNELEKEGTVISYSNAFAELDKKVTLAGNEKTVQDVLTTIFKDQRVSIIEKNNKILIVPAEVNKTLHSKDHYVINGFVKEYGSNEVLVAASVYVPGTSYGTVTNNYGYYSLSIPTGSNKLVYSYVGYRPDTVELKLVTERNDVILNRNDEMTEVVVSTDKESSPQHTHLSVKDIQTRPAILGENDVIRALQHIAGVQPGVDGSSTILVRGGDPGQNLNLLDGVPLYYVDHFFGLTSVYNSEAVKSVDFHKGAFPARYGGRLSSIIDVTTRDGNLEKWGGQFNMGLVKGSLNLEGPIIKNKSSIMLSARRTWVDVLWKPFTKDPSFNFYDINGKANYILNNNNRLYVSFYKGTDIIKSKIDGGSISTQWGNTIGSAKWNSVVNSRLFVNTILTYSLFKYKLVDTRQAIQYGSISNSSDYTGTSTINEVSQKTQANWDAAANQKVEFGYRYSHSVFVPVSVQSNSSNQTGAIAPLSSRFSTNEITLFAEDNIQINDRWMIRPGLHWATWFNKDFNYSALQPRFYTAYYLSPRHLIHGSFTQMTQYLHLVNNNSYGLPTDFWIPSTSIIEPEESLMGTVGYKGTPGRNFEYNIDLYYKDITGTVMYNMGKDLFDNTIEWQDKIVQGTGWSYGTEVSAEKQMGSFTAAFAYTLSWTWRKFSQLNDGRPFPYRYDRRHNLKTSLVYQRKKFEAAAAWTYMSGEAITIPDQVYPDFDRNLMIDPGNAYYSSNYTYNYTSWNNYRLPDIHRLDLSFKFIKQKKRVQRVWGLGVFNAYARKNVLFVQLAQDINTSQFSLEAYSFLQFIPYISYKLTF